MNHKVKWGVLSTAHIAINDVIPAMIKSKYCDIRAIASRNVEKAKSAANTFNIPKYFGSYSELLKDPEIEAVYIPLPNHLHVSWAIKSMRAGKHVLVEKPAGLSSKEAQELLDESQKHNHLKAMEAFMYRFHPQWIKVKELVNGDVIGKLKSIQTTFSFFDDNPQSIVNNMDFGGGSLMDIGCYLISLSRFLFDAEPKSVSATMEYHPEFKVDILTSAILEFDSGMATFFSSIQLAEEQKVKIYGTKGIIEIEVPFNPPIDKPPWISVNKNNNKEIIKFDICNQYSIQADLFSHAILNDTEVPTPLTDAVNNIKVLEKIVESDKIGKRVTV